MGKPFPPTPLNPSAIGGIGGGGSNGDGTGGGGGECAGEAMHLARRSLAEGGAGDSGDRWLVPSGGETGSSVGTTTVESARAKSSSGSGSGLMLLVELRSRLFNRRLMAAPLSRKLMLIPPSVLSRVYSSSGPGMIPVDGGSYRRLRESSYPNTMFASECPLSDISPPFFGSQKTLLTHQFGIDGKV
ncbi:hypothetical protein Tco_0027291 [Tanacetum coccineum]